MPLDSFKTLYPGVLVSVLIGVAAITLSQQYGMPVMILAILLGMALHSLSESHVFEKGITWSATMLLSIGVALLGLRIEIGILIGAGIIFPAVAIILLVVTLIIGFLISYWFLKDRYFAILIACAVAICGISAAAAVFCIFPKGKAKDEYLTLTIAGVTVLSTLAMIIYPAFALFIGFSDIQSGVFLGGSLHNVSQAIGAGYSVSNESGDIATLIKLIRVLLLLPVILIISALTAKDKNGHKFSWHTFLPPFLIAFVILIIGRAIGLIPDQIANIGSSFSEFCLIVSLVAIGVKTDTKQILSIGTKPIWALSLTTLFMAALTVVVLSIIIAI